MRTGKPFVYNLFVAIVLLVSNTSWAQSGITPEHIYMPNIRTVKLNLVGDYLTYPIISLNGSEKVELNFDDLDNDVKSYFYTLVLCNADWSVAQVNQVDYLRGFAEVPIRDYQFSSVSFQRYTHYRIELPGQNCYPRKSGNYLLKVYLDGDTSKLAFTKRLLVVDNRAGVTGFISQPVNPKFFKTHQKVNFAVNTQMLNVNNPFDQVKIVILQNNRWDNAIRNLKPMFLKGTIIEYNAENDCLFPGSKEWRWVDLRSFRLQTERVQKSDYRRNGTDIWVMPDAERSNTRYFYLKDINGQYFPGTLDGTDPSTQGDYALVHFSYPSPEPLAGFDMYLYGELTGYEYDVRNKLTYNAQTKAYEGNLFLKQGYYNYMYGTVDRFNNTGLSMEITEGDSWETENNYTILVYFRALGGRADELVGRLTLNTLIDRR
ncbi:type IX secretion system plug protein [Chitinophaga skermanii]|nr:DUF5103 domain-containing protein [Chitinophaga skermanii]